MVISKSQINFIDTTSHTIASSLHCHIQYFEFWFLGWNQGSDSINGVTSVDGEEWHRVGAEPYGPPALEVDSRGAMVGDRMRWGIYSTWTVSPLQYSHLWCQYWWHMATTFEAHGTSMTWLHLGSEENVQIHLRKEWSILVHQPSWIKVYMAKL